MDIVAESLSANLLRAQNVTVRGQDVLAWFESKLSSSVSFAGIFDDLSAAPARNGAVAIVGSKDYIYSSTTSAWQEFGDEGQIGVLMQAVAALSDELSCYAKKDEIPSVSAVSQLQNDAGYISAETDPVFQMLSSQFLTAEAEPALRALSSSFLTAETDPVFRELSSQFLTAHQSLSGYYGRSETSSAVQIQAALSDRQPAGSYLTANALSGKAYRYGDGTEWMAAALADVISAMGGTVEGFPG